MVSFTGEPGLRYAQGLASVNEVHVVDAIGLGNGPMTDAIPIAQLDHGVTPGDGVIITTAWADWRLRRRWGIAGGNP